MNSLTNEGTNNLLLTLVLFLLAFGEVLGVLHSFVFNKPPLYINSKSGQLLKPNIFPE